MNHKASSQKIPQSAPSSHCDFTHHHIHKLGDGLHEHPYPICGGSLGQWRRQMRQRLSNPDPAWDTPSEKITSRASAPGNPPWLELVANNKLPKDLDNPCACSKELTEEPCLHWLRPNATRCLVLDVLGNVREVGQLLVGTVQVDG
jgi:hypothetical protein